MVTTKRPKKQKQTKKGTTFFCFCFCFSLVLILFRFSFGEKADKEKTFHHKPPLFSIKILVLCRYLIKHRWFDIDCSPSTIPSMFKKQWFEFDSLLFPVSMKKYKYPRPYKNFPS